MSSPSAVLTRPDRDAGKIVGYTVKMTDGTSAKVAAETALADSSHIVVKTGFWILERKHMVPSAAVTSIDHDTRTVTVDMDHEQLMTSSEYTEHDATGHDEYHLDRRHISQRPVTVL